MSVSPGDNIPRIYSNFRGVDFTNTDVALTRSPDALNMYKDYKNSLGEKIETRPDIELLKNSSNTVFGFFFYTKNDIKHTIIHSGTQLIDSVNNVDTVLKSSGMNPSKSTMFVMNDKLYIIDGLNYLVYDGTDLKDVVEIATIPKTHISMSPTGNSVDSSLYQKVNLLTGIRKNSFCADGTSTVYQLDVETFDSNYTPIVWENGILLTPITDYTSDYTKGTITFVSAPSKPLSDGQDNVIIQFRKTVSGYAERIKKCTIIELFDNRVFFSGNVDYPNTIFWSELNDPNYISDINYQQDGDSSLIKTMAASNNTLWVMKEPSQSNSSIYYHVPTGAYDDLGNYYKTYPSSHSSISSGCVSRGINFNDDIVFFSNRGLEGITGNIQSEQLLSHRSTFVDNKMLNESKYKNVILAEWEGYLLCIFDKNIYLADSRSKTAIENHYEYEWFFWTITKPITCVYVNDDILYLGASDGIYSLTSKTTDVESYWTTLNDEFGYPYYQKTTSKRGGTINVSGEVVSLSYSVDKQSFIKLGDYINTKGYVVFNLKAKKFKSLQLKISGKRFGLEMLSIIGFLGNYVKR